MGGIFIASHVHTQSREVNVYIYASFFFYMVHDGPF